MRKITKESIAAFLNSEVFKKQNMEVTVYNEKVCLWLHGNCIATQEGNILKITHCGWKTNTTKERLNGLPNVRINQKIGVWFLNGEIWDGELTEIKL